MEIEANLHKSENHRAQASDEIPPHFPVLS
ncbi:hypothetical protein CCACVL1_24765, partial [Corchorus capsularis]